ncbi:heme peroxidase [Naganishia albida]|nr:heme peroxidase [Naganishia albida]
MAARFTPALRAAAGARVAARRQVVPAMRRGFASEAPKSGSSNGLLIGGLAAAAAGGAYYFLATDATPKERLKELETAGKEAGAVAEAALHMKRKPEDYQKVYNRIAEKLEADDYDDGSYGPVLIRLAWHSSGTYNKEDGSGGSNYATMRFKPESEHGANNGLKIARDLLEPIKQEFPWISYGDLWTLAGVCAVQEAQGPKVPWRPGRIDGYDHNCTPDGRLPDGAKAQDHLREIFYRMGFNDQEIVALCGAHAMGRCHTDRSGFDGPWTFSPTTFTNDYYRLLFDEKWSWRKWNGPAQFTDSKTKSLMMLPADMSLTKDKEFKKHAKAYAQDADLFFKDFAKVFNKLIELGVPTAQFQSDAYTLKTLDEQS